MTSPQQKAANRLNAIKSTGPKTQEGIRSASLNAVKHRLSLPVSEQLYGQEIDAVSALVRDECISEQQAKELAKRIIDYERNEQYLQQLSLDEVQGELQAWMHSAVHLELVQLVNAHENKQKVWQTFTTSDRKPKGKARVEELRFLKGFLNLQKRVLFGNISRAKKTQDAAMRYHKRAINQLIKAAHHLSRGEEF